jgi:hypothetical protein
VNDAGSPLSRGRRSGEHHDIDPNFVIPAKAQGRHSRESANPVSFHERRWVPAFAGTTIGVDDLLTLDVIKDNMPIL